MKERVKKIQSFFSSAQFSSSVVSDSLRPHELQHARPPCPSPTPGVHRNPCPLSQWCHPTISSSVVPFSSCPQSFPASRSFQMSQLFASCGQSIGASASKSVLPMNTQDWPPLGWTGWISLLSKGLLRVFSNTTVQNHRFFPFTHLRKLVFLLREHQFCPFTYLIKLGFPLKRVEISLMLRSYLSLWMCKMITKLSYSIF